MPEKLPSQTFSSGSLVEGAKVLREQQVKQEPSSEEMEAELEDTSGIGCGPSMYWGLIFYLSYVFSFLYVLWILSSNNRKFLLKIVDISWNLDADPVTCHEPKRLFCWFLVAIQVQKSRFEKTMIFDRTRFLSHFMTSHLIHDRCLNLRLNKSTGIPKYSPTLFLYLLLSVFVCQKAIANIERKLCIAETICSSYAVFWSMVIYLVWLWSLWEFGYGPKAKHHESWWCPSLNFHIRVKAITL